MFNWFSRPHNWQNLYPPFLLFVYKLVHNAKHRITAVIEQEKAPYSGSLFLF
jgi:hypothetical protein